MDKWFLNKQVTGPMTKLEYEDLFANMGIGRGIKEYERGKKELTRWEYNWLDYEQALKALAKWCEI